MAKQNKENPDLGELIRRSDAARASLSQSGTALKQKLNFAGRAKDAVIKEPAKAIGGSLVAGFILKKLLFRKKKTSSKAFEQVAKISHLKKERGLLLGLLALLGTLAKPAVKMYATKLLKDYLKRRFLVGADSRPRAAPLRHY
ncbi:MAG: hypothetical protein NWT08_09660 [Akkermansiaceae bacterium]|jgi:hypothetical protein|nr:hypothetical protein [Akkermansiaceae bacterium]MDP4647308.1 hypothetical protein [Akkermansiaceae bacterium]MDP4721900.1 hypothetical protein [Akkermansiaceae bacterium]MDP4780957.1 hypothetical protein [Akkermansiaceae bacterium]MDP4847458.1 hypothetical protein [Akkermansiaceae bacterium]